MFFKLRSILLFLTAYYLLLAIISLPRGQKIYSYQHGAKFQNHTLSEPRLELDYFDYKNQSVEFEVESDPALRAIYYVLNKLRLGGGVGDRVLVDFSYQNQSYREVILLDKKIDLKNYQIDSEGNLVKITFKNGSENYNENIFLLNDIYSKSSILWLCIFSLIALLFLNYFLYGAKFKEDLVQILSLSLMFALSYFFAVKVPIIWADEITKRSYLFRLGSFEIQPIYYLVVALLIYFYALYQKREILNFRISLISILIYLLLFIIGREKFSLNIIFTQLVFVASLIMLLDNRQDIKSENSEKSVFKPYFKYLLVIAIFALNVLFSKGAFNLAPSIADTKVLSSHAEEFAKTGSLKADIKTFPAESANCGAIKEREKWYSIYAPLNIIAQALFFKLNLLKIYSPILSIFAGLLIYKLADLLYGGKIAFLTLLLFGISPHARVIFSEFGTHSLCAVAVLGAAIIFIKLIKRIDNIGESSDKKSIAALALFLGVILGLITLTRPLTGVSFAAILLAYMLYRSFALGAQSVLTFLLTFAIYLIYNRITTGEFFLFAQSLRYHGLVNIGFGDTDWGYHSLLNGIRNISVFILSESYTIGFALLPMFLILANSFSLNKFKENKNLVLVVAACSVVLFHILFFGAEYLFGPRYIFEISLVLLPSYGYFLSNLYGQLRFRRIILFLLLFIASSHNLYKYGIYRENNVKLELIKDKNEVGRFEKIWLSY